MKWTHASESKSGVEITNKGLFGSREAHARFVEYPLSENRAHQRWPVAS